MGLRGSIGGIAKKLATSHPTYKAVKAAYKGRKKIASAAKKVAKKHPSYVAGKAIVKKLKGGKKKERYTATRMAMMKKKARRPDWRKLITKFKRSSNKKLLKKVDRKGMRSTNGKEK